MTPNLIEYLLQKQVCFAVVGANSFGGISDFFVIVHDTDYKHVKDRFCKSHFFRGCYMADLEGNDYKAFKSLQAKVFNEKDLGQHGTAYELKGSSFSEYRKKLI